jgi:hypothetical protein
MDQVIHFIFWGIVEYVFFRVGRIVLRCITFGYIRLEKPTPLQTFLVAPIGFTAIVLGIVGVYSAFSYLK